LAYIAATLSQGLIVIVRTGAEMVLSVHRSWASPYSHHRQWDSRRSLGLLLDPGLTGGTGRLMDEAWKRLVRVRTPHGPHGAVAGCGRSLSPDPDQARREPQDSKQQKCMKKQVVHHLSFPLQDR